MVIPRYNQDWLIYVKYYWNPIYGDHSPYESIRQWLLPWLHDIYCHEISQKAIFLKSTENKKGP